MSAAMRRRATSLWKEACFHFNGTCHSRRVDREAVANLEEKGQFSWIENGNVLLSTHTVCACNKGCSTSQTPRKKALEHRAKKHLMGASNLAGVLRKQVESLKLCG
jgi:hypothetical protein